MAAFVNAHVNASRGHDEGMALAEKYGIHGYPTLLVVDEKGEEIDRIVGFRPPEKFLPEVARILRGEGTLPALKKAVADDPKSLDAALALAEKQLDRDDAEGAAKTIKAVPEDVKPK